LEPFRFHVNCGHFRAAVSSIWGRHIFIQQACTTCGRRNLSMRPARAFSIEENVAKLE